MLDETALPALEEIIIDASREPENRRLLQFPVTVPNGEQYYVKFDCHYSLLPQIRTQSYVADIAALNPQAPRIPRVLHHFKYEEEVPGAEPLSWTYIVMEFIHLEPEPGTPAEIAVLKKRAADAVIWLAETVPVPPDHAPGHMGPVGGGVIRDPFFQDYRAPFEFISIEALERYMGSVFEILPFKLREGLKPAEIRNDRIMFTQSDMQLTNFGVEEDTGKTVIMDFDMVGLLPESFITVGMNNEYQDVIAALNLRTDNRDVMFRTGGMLIMMGDPTLGLNSHGYPNERKVDLEKPKMLSYHSHL